MPRPLTSLVALCCCAAALLFAAPAGAADSVWWTNYEGDNFGIGPTLGGPATTLAPTPAAPLGPYGSVVDAATGKLYWANYDGSTIGVSNLDGSGATTLNTTGATVQNPAGVAIDPSAGRIYWANQTADKISWAAFDGSGGGDLATPGATVEMPTGVAVFPATGRVYWANRQDNSIGSANLNGSAGGDLTIPESAIDGPDGVAINAATNTIYWTNNEGGSIGFVSLAGPGTGHGAGLLMISGAPLQHPTGIAIDPETGFGFPPAEPRIYWADEGAGGVYSASLTGGPAARVDNGVGAVAEPSFPFLFEPPESMYNAAPAVLLGAKPGSTLTCGLANRWKADLPESGLFRAPQSVAIQWTRDGAAIPGANGPTLTTTVEGSYSCHILATNGAGTTDGGGGTWEVRTREEPHQRPLLVVLKLKRSHKSGTATIVTRVSGPGTATLTGEQVVRRSVKSSGAGVVKVAVAAKGKALRRLKQTGKVKVAIRLGFRTTEGSDIFISRAITLSRKIRR